MPVGQILGVYICLVGIAVSAPFWYSGKFGRKNQMLIKRFFGTQSPVTKPEPIPGEAVYTALFFWQSAVQTLLISPAGLWPMHFVLWIFK